MNELANWEKLSVYNLQNKMIKRMGGENMKIREDNIYERMD